MSTFLNLISAVERGVSAKKGLADGPPKEKDRAPRASRRALSFHPLGDGFNCGAVDRLLCNSLMLMHFSETAPHGMAFNCGN
jgi:hypothetical protein